MSTAAVALLALGLSLLALAGLAWRDPKRLRAARARSRGSSARRRRALAATLLLPGLALCALGHWSALLIWMGGTLVSGWLLANALSYAATRAGGAENARHSTMPASTTAPPSA